MRVNVACSSSQFDRDTFQCHVENETKIPNRIYKRMACVKEVDEVRLPRILCIPCKSEILVQYRGRDDCRRHVNSAKHRDNARRVAENTDVRTFFSINTEQLNVTRAEFAMVNFLIEHNLALAAADHATSMFNTVFVDSKIAKHFACRRTKAANVLYFLAEKEQKALAEKMRTQPFTLATIDRVTLSCTL